MKHIKTFENFNSNSINEDLESVAKEVKDKIEEVLSPEEIKFLSQVYKKNGKEIVAKGIEDVSNKKTNEDVEVPNDGDMGMSANEIKLRRILDKVIKTVGVVGLAGILPAMMAGAPFVALGLGIASLVGCVSKDAAWWKSNGHNYDLQDKYGVK